MRYSSNNQEETVQEEEAEEAEEADEKEGLVLKANTSNGALKNGTTTEMDSLYVKLERGLCHILSCYRVLQKLSVFRNKPGGTGWFYRPGKYKS